jgi:hypothetical protein
MTDPEPGGMPVMITCVLRSSAAKPKPASSKSS